MKLSTVLSIKYIPLVNSKASAGLYTEAIPVNGQIQSVSVPIKHFFCHQIRHLLIKTKINGLSWDQVIRRTSFLFSLSFPSQPFWWLWPFILWDCFWLEVKRFFYWYPSLLSHIHLTEGQAHVLKKSLYFSKMITGTIKIQYNKMVTKRQRHAKNIITAWIWRKMDSHPAVACHWQKY